jgi:hypothetical protein
MIGVTGYDSASGGDHMQLRRESAWDKHEKRDSGLR